VPRRNSDAGSGVGDAVTAATVGAADGPLPLPISGMNGSGPSLSGPATGANGITTAEAPPAVGTDGAGSDGRDGDGDEPDGGAAGREG